MTTIQVTKRLRVESLLEIGNPEFSHWYELGVWWALYGDGQGNSQYCDQYLFDTVLNHLKSGWYDNPADGWFPMIGFTIGMIHGGNIDPVSCEIRSSCSLVVLHDPDFTKGYRVGREYYFTEAPLVGRKLSDSILCDTIHGWALEYRQWHDQEEVLRYTLGCRIGELSGALFPEMLPATAS